MAQSLLLTMLVLCITSFAMHQTCVCSILTAKWLKRKFVQREIEVLARAKRDQDKARTPRPNFYA